jgi:L,D-peptidoglycan transpeptidase YkuD (ErfK/YbiS/YcfS/YnhG family)
MPVDLESEWEFKRCIRMPTQPSRRTIIATAAGLLINSISASAAAKARSNLIEVRAAKRATHGALHFNGRRYPCALGRSGIVHPKHEGDGGTPAGAFPLHEARYRADRMARPKTGLDVFEISPTDAWCDEPADSAYNRLVQMPYHGDAEAMWREDHAYDVLAVIGYNAAPPVPGAGSAIFLHVAHITSDGLFLPTAGCVALKMDDLLAVLAACKPGTMIDIRAI